MILFMKALKQSEKRLFSPFVQISRQFGGNRRGFSLANSAHVADVKVWSLFVISICWGKFALKITEKKQPCLYNKPSRLLYFQADTFFLWIKYLKNNPSPGQGKTSLSAPFSNTAEKHINFCVVGFFSFILRSLTVLFWHS